MIKYKESGIEWIGQIPEDWEVVRLKDKYRAVKEIVGDKVTEFDRLALTLQGVIKRNKDDDNGLQPEKFDNYQILRKNDLVFKMIDLQNVSTSRVGLSPYDGIVSPAYLRFQQKNNQENKFLYYYLLSLWHNEVYNSLGGDGVRSSLSAENMGLICCPYPKHDIQQKIADFLDKKCAQIDELIKLQENEIEKLKEYKQSVITEVVTKGLDKSAKMKDSGIEWIGQIPESWELRRLKTFAELISKGATPKDMSSVKDEFYKIRFMKAENILNGKVIDNHIYFIDKQTHEQMKRSQLKENDILFVIAGATIGKTAILPKQCIPSNTNQAISFIRLKEKYIKINEYIKLLLESNITKEVIRQNTVQSAQPNISMENLGNIFSSIPSSIEEIEELLNYTNKINTKIDNLVAIKTDKIERLQEYKKSLIYECVTGKRRLV